MFGRTLHPHGHATGAEVDRRDAPRLCQGEERIGHQVLGVARRHVARQRTEQVELFALRHRLHLRQRWAGHGDGYRRADGQRRPC